MQKRTFLGALVALFAGVLPAIAKSNPVRHCEWRALSDQSSVAGVRFDIMDRVYGQCMKQGLFPTRVVSCSIQPVTGFNLPCNRIHVVVEMEPSDRLKQDRSHWPQNWQALNEWADGQSLLRLSL